MREEIEQTKEIPTRDFVDAADVKGIYLYRKDGCIVCYLRIYPFNLDLLVREDRRGKADNLAAGYKNDNKDFVYFSLPREIDLDRYKQNLKMRYKSANTIGKRHIVAMNMEECADLITNGENYEHQHFIRVWEMVGDKKNKNGTENNLRERITDFHNLFKGVGIKTEILKEPEIVKLCNLFGNSLQASFENVEQSTMYTPMLQIRD